MTGCGTPPATVPRQSRAAAGLTGREGAPAAEAWTSSAQAAWGGVPWEPARELYLRQVSGRAVNREGRDHAGEERLSDTKVPQNLEWGGFVSYDATPC